MFKSTLVKYFKKTTINKNQEYEKEISKLLQSLKVGQPIVIKNNEVCNFIGYKTGDNYFDVEIGRVTYSADLLEFKAILSSESIKCPCCGSYIVEIGQIRYFKNNNKYKFCPMYKENSVQILSKSVKTFRCINCGFVINISK